MDIDNIPDVDLMQQISDALIGQIASYLAQKSYHRFATTSKFIRKACNSPNRLGSLCLVQSQSVLSRMVNQIIDDIITINYSEIDLSRYQSLCSFSFYLDKFSDFNFQPNSRIGKCLKSMNLWLCNPPPPDIDIQAFMATQHIILDELKYLSMNNFGGKGTRFNATTFTTILTKFPMIHELDLYVVVLNQPINTDVLKLCFPNLIKLSLNKTNLTKIMINALGSQLTSLCFEQFHDEIFEEHVDEDLNFHKLSELSVTNPSKRTMNTILATAMSLKYITYQPSAGDIRNQNNHMDNSQIEATLIEMLAGLALEKLSIWSWSNLMTVNNSIELGLYKAKQTTKKEINIEVIILYEKRSQQTAPCPKDFLLSISRIVHILLASKIEIFSVVWSWDETRYPYRYSGINSVEMRQYVNELIELTPELNITMTSKKEMSYENYAHYNHIIKICNKL